MRTTYAMAITYDVRMSPSTPPRTRRPRGSLTSDAILDAAEAVAVDGFDALTMREVAARLGAAPMSLYRYYATKDELVDALLDRVLGRLDVPPVTADWADDVRAYVLEHRRLLEENPWAVSVLFTHPTPGPNSIAIGEELLGRLDRGGVTGEAAVVAFSALLALNYGWSAFTSGRDSGAPDAADLAERLRSLPAAVFPLTVAVAEPMSRYGSDEHYEQALGLLLRGLSPAPRRKR